MAWEVELNPAFASMAEAFNFSGSIVRIFLMFLDRPNMALAMAAVREPSAPAVDHF